ncbi:MAG: TIGR00730 family Rossman fold protein [Sporichthyaceae bacterium]
MATIAVFCASSEAIGTHHKELAAEVGAELAARGHRLVSGGGSISSMGALARAARAGGAHTIGVIPQALVDHEVADHDADELLVTPDMRTRKGAMDARADAFLVLPGGIGTLEELLEIWVARSLGMHDRPVVVLDPTGVYDPLRAQIDLLLEQGFVRPAAVDVVAWTRTVAEAFAALEAPTATAEVVAEEVLEAEA